MHATHGWLNQTDALVSALVVRTNSLPPQIKKNIYVTIGSKHNATMMQSENKNKNSPISCWQLAAASADFVPLSLSRTHTLISIFFGSQFYGLSLSHTDSLVKPDSHRRPFDVRTMRFPSSLETIQSLPDQSKDDAYSLFRLQQSIESLQDMPLSKRIVFQNGASLIESIVRSHHVGIAKRWTIECMFAERLTRKLK